MFGRKRRLRERIARTERTAREIGLIDTRHPLLRYPDVALDPSGALREMIEHETDVAMESLGLCLDGTE